MVLKTVLLIGIVFFLVSIQARKGYVATLVQSIMGPRGSSTLTAVHLSLCKARFHEL